MLVIDVRNFLSKFLPGPVLKTLIIGCLGLAVMDIILFSAILVVASFYALVFTSIYYLWISLFNLAPI